MLLIHNKNKSEKMVQIKNPYCITGEVSYCSPINRGEIDKFNCYDPDYERHFNLDALVNPEKPIMGFLHRVALGITTPKGFFEDVLLLDANNKRQQQQKTEPYGKPHLKKEEDWILYNIYEGNSSENLFLKVVFQDYSKTGELYIPIQKAHRLCNVGDNEIYRYQIKKKLKNIKFNLSEDNGIIYFGAKDVLFTPEEVEIPDKYRSLERTVNED